MMGCFPDNPPQFISPSMERTMETVRRILDQNKNVQYASEVDHKFEDKYALVEFLTNTGIAATLNVLEQLDGFNEEVLKKAMGTVQDEKRSMTLRLAVEEKCDFLEETTRTVEPLSSHQVTVESNTSDSNGVPTSTNSSTVSHKVMKEVKEFHWQASYNHKVILFSGTDDTQGIVLGKRAGTTNLITSMKQEPFQPKQRHPIDVDATFLFAHIDKNSLVSSFGIDREAAKTPRRNKQVEEAMAFINSLKGWSMNCIEYFRHTVRHDLLSAYKDSCPADWLGRIETSNVFVPITPLFQENAQEEEPEASMVENRGLVSLQAPPADSPILRLTDTTQFLQEQSRSLQKSLHNLMSNYPDASDQGQFVTGYEAKLVMLWSHLIELTLQWRSGIGYVEDMLRTQLISAIGKEVDAQDFRDFLRFHNQRVFSKSHSPKPFCYAIRQPSHYPDGVLSIVADDKSSLPKSENGKREPDPIETFSRKISGDDLATPISIPLNAATTVEFVGDQYLHGWMDTHFAGQQNQGHHISARARQFSCFLLMTGTISGPEEFTPSDAIILQNKDEVLIPLLTTALPSAKEFRDAIKSLSPEQARFAKSYRAMQLDSSVFGVCVIQVKPQMEALLNLPPNALTKEIRLTQDLLSLFVDYQIPPNLVSYDGDEAATLADKVNTVKQHVKGVLDVVQGLKDSQLEEEKKRADARVEMARTFNPESHVLMQMHQMAAPPMQMAMASVPPPGAGGAQQHIESASADACFEQECDDYEALESLEVGDFDVLQDKSDANKARDMDWWNAAAKQTDFTSIPKKLDKMFESYDTEGALRTVTLKAGEQWSRRRQENLLTEMKKTFLKPDERKSETNKALDLLDALSRSGSLPIASGELHVLVGVRHSFEQNIMATVIEENVNPIEKVDYSSLLMAATVHQVDIPTLLVNSAEPPTLVLKDRKFPAPMIENGGNHDIQENE